MGGTMEPRSIRRAIIYPKEEKKQKPESQEMKNIRESLADFLFNKKDEILQSPRGKIIKEDKSSPPVAKILVDAKASRMFDLTAGSTSIFPIPQAISTAMQAFMKSDPAKADPTEIYKAVIELFCAGPNELHPTIKNKLKKMGIPDDQLIAIEGGLESITLGYIFRLVSNTQKKEVSIVEVVNPDNCQIYLMSPSDDKIQSEKDRFYLYKDKGGKIYYLDDDKKEQSLEGSLIIAEKFVSTKDNLVEYTDNSMTKKIIESIYPTDPRTQMRENFPEFFKKHFNPAQLDQRQRSFSQGAG